MKVFLLILFVMQVAFQNAKSQSRIPITSTNKQAIQYYESGFMAADRGDLKEAENFYKQAIQKDTSFAIAYMQLALLQAQYSNRSAFMAKAMQHVHNISEGEKLWILGRNSFYGNGKREEEFGYFEKLVGLYPKDPVAQYLFGYMNHHHGRKNFTKAIEHLEASVKLNPNFITALDDLAVAYMEVRDFQNAERILLKEISLLPNKVKPKDSYAELLLRSGKYERAIKAYKEALAIDPVYSWSVFGLAASLNFSGKHLEARHSLSALSSIALTERETYHLMYAYEMSYLDEGKFDSVIFVLKQHEKWAKEKNLFTPRYLALSHTTRIFFEYEDTLNGMKAFEELNHVIQNESQNQELKKQANSLRKYYASYTFFIGGQLDKAKKSLEEFNQERGRIDDQSRLLQARIHLKTGDVSKAEELIRQCDPENPYVQYWMGQVLLRSNKKEDALKLFQRIAERNEMQELDYHLVRKKAIAALQ